MEAGKLTIGIVTIPFLFEGKRKILQALKGLTELRKYVDAILVINNERLIEVCGELSFKEAFALADSTLSNAARGISDMVNLSGNINIDFADVETTLKGGGVAIIATGVAKGEKRILKAITKALESPLINHNSIRNAKRLLICVYGSEHSDVMTHELSNLNDFTSSLNKDFDNIYGQYTDNSLGEGEVKVTVLASGFDYETTEQSLKAEYNSLEARELEAKKKEEDALLLTYYGEHASKIGKPKSARPLIFDIDELDDEELLELAERSPAFTRDLTAVEELRQRRKQSQSAQLTSQASVAQSVEPSPAPESPSKAQDDEPNTIYF